MGFSDACHRDTFMLILNTIISSGVAAQQTKENANVNAVGIVVVAVFVDIMAGLSIHRLARRGLSEDRAEMISNNCQTLLVIATMMITNAACFAAFRFINDEPVNDPTTAAAWLASPLLLTLMLCNGRVVKDTCTQLGAQNVFPRALDRMFADYETPRGELSEAALLDLEEGDSRRGRQNQPRQGGIDDDSICVTICCPRSHTN